MYCSIISSPTQDILYRVYLMIGLQYTVSISIVKYGNEIPFYA